MVRQRFATTLFTLLVCAPHLAMSNTAQAYTAPTEFSNSGMYTDFVIVNTTELQMAERCLFLNTYTEEGHILTYTCEVFCNPGQYLCTNGSFEVVEACTCPAQIALAYIALVNTCASLLGCFVALWIYSFFCRNLIKLERDTSRTHWVHLNLIISFILRDIVTVATLTSEINKRFVGFVPMFSYIMECNFFWMFVEGMYLFIYVSFPYYRIDSSPRLCTKLSVFAWGVPSVLVAIWVVAEVERTAVTTVSSIHQNTNSTSEVDTQSSSVNVTSTSELDRFDTQALPAYMCMHIWTFILLMLNLLMLIRILLMLREKLQDTPTLQEQNSKHRRLAKATLVLAILLGVPNIFPFLFNRVEDFIGAKGIYIINFIFVMMNSIQGLMVAILYVLCNTEVKRQLHRKCSTSNSCICLRRDDRRRNTRFGSLAQDTTRRTIVNNNSTSASSKGSVSVGISAGSNCSDAGSDKTAIEQQKTFLPSGEKHLSGNNSKLNSNDSHTMIVIEETEQESLLSGLNHSQPASIRTGPSPVNAAYKKSTENPETYL